MIEKVKRAMDKGGHFSALRMDLSKVFDCLPQDLIIAKLDAHGFKNDAHRSALAKILSVEFQKVLYWVP